MTQCNRILLCLTMLMSMAHLCNAGTTNKIIPRSQSFNAARQMVGWNNPEWGINRYPQDSLYTSFNLTFEYTRTFKPANLAYSLFGDDTSCICNTTAIEAGVNIVTQGLYISGSAASDRGPHDWLADYFGLPRDYQSTVLLVPRIQNFILDFSLYLGLDRWLNGLYFKIYGPYVNTRWSLNATENITSTGSLGYFQGYFSSNDVPVANLTRTFLEYGNGNTVPRINNNYALYGEASCETYGPCSDLGTITWQPLCCSRFDNSCACDNLVLNGFAELRFVLGYNFLDNAAADYHLGAGIYAAAPTGSRIGEGKTGLYAFEPIVGNGKHWELGGQITAHQIWWRSDDEEKSFGFYLEANITHLFAACQTRCFDLCSAGINSRYMLAQELSSNGTTYPMLESAVDTLGLEFANNYAPVANLTRRSVTSTISAQGDVAFCLSYNMNGFQWDLGYNFWGRSCEKLCINNSSSSSMGTWALKGDERVYGFVNNGPMQSLAIKLAVSDSQATIHAGSNLTHSVDYTPIQPMQVTNFYADNIVSLADNNVAILPESSIAIYASNPPIFIQECDFNLGGTTGFSHKLFTHFNWAWTENENRNWVPYLGVGAEVELSSAKGPCCPNNCFQTGCTIVSCSRTINNCSNSGECCPNCAPNQWGVWFKIGTSYN